MSKRGETPERPEADSGSGFGKSTRRTFLSRIGMASLLATTAPVVTTFGQRSEKVGQGLSAAAKDAIPVTLRVNGKKYDLRIDPRTTLLDCLREHLHLTGSKKGCDHGQCGACTVLVNGRRIVSCLTLAVMKDGAEITTIEGLATNGQLHPLQKAFISHDGFQCGYCTPGQICSAVGLIAEGHAKTADEIRELMSGNVCRCGCYPNIVAAIEEVMQGASPGSSS